MGIFSSIGSSIVDGIDSLLADTGEWASSILDAGAKVYNRFVDVAYALVTKDIHDGTFADFWKVIDTVTGVFVAVASVLLVLMFLYTLVQTSLAPQHEVDIKSIVIDFIKMLLCNLLITQAVNIVSAIFTFGTKLASAAVGGVAGQGIKVTDPERGLDEAVKTGMRNGVGGISGLLVVILALIGAVVMIGSALMIVLEIYKRFFRVFVLIPFASISFTTSVMGDGHGNEVFKGYLKSIIATALEAVIISMCLAFCAVLTIPPEGEAQSSFMGSLFSFVSKDTGVKTMEINNYEELENFVQYAYARERSSFSDVAGTVGWISNDWGLAKLGDFDYYRVEYINGFKKADNTNQSNPVDELLGAVSEKVVPAYPVRVIVGKRLSLGAGLILVLQTIFPMVLTAGAIKEAPGYASKVMGL